MDNAYDSLSALSVVDKRKVSVAGRELYFYTPSPSCSYSPVFSITDIGGRRE
jgi:hypothetical protein